MDTSNGGKAVPVLFGIDAVHGQSNIIGATLFPHNIGLGATRNPELLRQIGGITALETRVTGMEWTFAPTVAVPQDDRWGRTYEGYSESPEVVASYAGAMVEGIAGQGRDARVSRWPSCDRVGEALPRRWWHHRRQDQGDTRISEADLVRIHAAGYPRRSPPARRRPWPPSTASTVKRCTGTGITSPTCSRAHAVRWLRGR